MNRPTYEAIGSTVYKKGQPWTTTPNHYAAEAHAKRANAREARENRAARQSHRAIASLTHDEYEALIRYVDAHGRTWKAKLNAYWLNGKLGPNSPEDEPRLRSIRNKIGPSGLMKLRLRRQLA
jgi:hypothetical protein